MTAAARIAREFPGRRVLVTGAASGLGLAVIRELVTEPGVWKVAMLDLDRAKLEVARDALRSVANPATEFHPYALDVRELAAQRRAAEDFVAGAGGIDVALHAAGVAVTGPFADGAPEDWQWVFDINLHGVANSCRAVLPAMLRQGSGLIVNVASAASFCTGPMMSAYNASKAAVVALSETLMQEYGPKGVRTLVAMPGFFRTNLLNHARGPGRTLEGARRIMESSHLEADVVARELLAAAADGAAHWVYPPQYRKLWRLKRLMPTRFQKLMLAQLQRRS